MAGCSRSPASLGRGRAALLGGGGPPFPETERPAFGLGWQRFGLWRSALQGEGAGDKNPRGSMEKRLLGMCRPTRGPLVEHSRAARGGGLAGQATFPRGKRCSSAPRPSGLLIATSAGGEAARVGLSGAASRPGSQLAFRLPCQPRAGTALLPRGCLVTAHLPPWSAGTPRRGCPSPPVCRALTGGEPRAPPRDSWGAAADSRPPLGVARLGPGEAPALGPRPPRHDSRRPGRVSPPFGQKAFY